MTYAPAAPPLPRRRLGRTNLEVSIVGVGGKLGMLTKPAEANWVFTEPADLWKNLSTDQAAKEAAAIAAVERAAALGFNYFDTAPMYFNGEAERCLGLGLKALPPAARAGLVISTKVGWHPERQHQYDADSVYWSVEKSLATLYASRLDLVHIHYPLSDEHMDQMLGPGGAVEALERLKAEGVVGAISLGSRPHRFLRRAIESGRFDAVMTVYDYNPIRASAGAVIELAAQHGVGVLNASPYNGGLLAGPDPDVAAARRPPELTGDLHRARALWHWAREHGVEIGALAVQFSLRDPRIDCTLVGPRDTSEVEDNLRHATTPLPDDLWTAFDDFLQSLGPWTPGGEAGVLA